MKWSTVCFCLLSVISVSFSSWGYICDDEFHIQYAVETILEGSDPSQMTVVSTTTLGGELTGITLLHDSTEYRILTDFQGACNLPEKNPMTYTVRARGTQAFSDLQDTSLFIQMYNNQLGETNISLWFGLGTDTADGAISNLSNAVGTDDLNTPFYQWYGNAVFIDSTRNSGTGLWERTTNYYRNTTAYIDSVHIDTSLMGDWRALTFDGDNRRGFFRQQFIKVFYDTLPTGNILQAAMPVFQNTLQLRVGERLFQKEYSGTRLPEKLTVYSIRGEKISDLFMNGRVYYWDGFDRYGRSVSSGVYLIRANRKAVGKVYFIR